MKKFLVITVICALLSLSFVGCAKKKEEYDPPADTPTPVITVEPTMTPQTTEQPATTDDPMITDDPNVTDDPMADDNDNADDLEKDVPEDETTESPS